MNKFLIVFRKEIKELMSVQMLIPIVLIFVMFYFMGNFIHEIGSDEKIEIDASEVSDGVQTAQTLDDNADGGTVTVSKSSVIGMIDNDNSEMSKYIVDTLRQYGMTIVTPSSSDPATACGELLEYNLDGNPIDIKLLVVLNNGLEENLKSGEYTPAFIDIYSTISSFGMMSSISSASSSGILDVINSIVSDKMFEFYIPDTDRGAIAYVQRPVYGQSHTYMNGKTTMIDSGSIIGYISSNTVFVPIIVYLIIIYSTQTLASSVVNEKADKTLETLMTTPVSRMAVLFAKVLAAALYSVIYAVIFIIGFKNYMGDMTGGGVYSPELNEAIELFGISFNATAFIVIGIQMFLSVLCGLGIALILGMMVEDIKTLQAYIMPLLIVIMIPYFVSMFTDMNTLPMIAQVLLYIIPFTHTFAAATNLFTQNYMILVGGMIYQIIFVAAMLTIAVKIFNSDKLITLSEIIKTKSAKRKSGLKINL